MRWLMVLACAGCGYAPSVADKPADGQPDPDEAVTGDTPIDEPGAPTLPVLIQEQGTEAPSGASLAIALPALPQAGHLLIMVGGANAGGLTSVTGGGATWTRAAQSLARANIEVWYGITDGSTATVAVNRTANSSFIWIAVSEWSGLQAVLDGSDVSFGTNGTASAGPISTTNARDLLVFAAADDQLGVFGTPVPGPSQGPFAIISGGPMRQHAWFEVVTTAGSFAAQVSDSGTDWDAALVAFQIAP